MEKEIYKFVFPEKNVTETLSLNPFQVKDVSIAYVTRQNEVRGDLCLVFDEKETLVAVVHCDDHMVARFFIDDTAAQEIPTLHDAAFDD